MKQHDQEILNYYDSCEKDYRTFWDLDHSFAMHSGYWDSTTRSLRQALRRENEILAEMANVKAGERILDAGCGVGGSSFFLAEKGCSVDGITLSAKQVETARRHADTLPVQIRPRFHVMDYCSTVFPDAIFDVVWAIESVCHAQDKEIFIKEAHRLLKPGGRLIIADGFIVKEGKGMAEWMKGWAIGELATLPGFQVCLKRAGFTIEQTKDITQNIMPSSRRLYWISLPMLLFSKVGEWFGWRTARQTDNIKAAYWHHKTLRQRLWKYYIVLSTKV